MSRAAGGAVEHVVDPRAKLTPRREQRGRVEVPLHGPLEADARPRLVQWQLPVEPDHVPAARCGVLEIRARPEREVDHRHVRTRDRREELAVVGRDVAQVVLTPERASRPGVEDLERLRPGARLREQVVGLHGRELRQQPPPRRRLGEHECLRLREVLRRAALDRVAGERERGSGEADHRHAPRLELAAHDRDRRERPRHRLLRRRRPEQVDVPSARDRPLDPRAVALHEIELEAHADERREDVRKDDGRVHSERVHGQQRHLRRELGRADQLEHGVLLAQRPVLRHVAPRLPQQPDRSSLDRKPPTGSQEQGSRRRVRKRQVTSCNLRCLALGR